MFKQRLLAAAATIATLCSSIPAASAYFIEDVTSGYRVPQKVMPLSGKDWPSWIAPLQGQRTVTPSRLMYKPSLDDKDWPSWIGKL